MGEAEQVIRWVLDENSENIRALEDALGCGNARNYETYTHICGQIMALKKLNGVLVDKLQQYIRGEVE